MSKRWYIDYRIWDTDKQDFVRKQYTGMNKYTTLRDRRRVSKDKLKEIQQLLQEGYTAGETPAVTLGLDPKKATVQEAIEWVVARKAAAGIGLEFYNVALRRIREYRTFGNLPLRFLTLPHVTNFLEQQSKRGITAKTYNNYRNSLNASFNYLVKQEILTRNPCQPTELRRVEASPIHTPYTEAERQRITAEIQARGDEQLLLYIGFIYYGFIRSGSELRLLRVKDIKARTVLIPADRAKNNKAEHVGIVRQLETLIDQAGLRNYPPDYYIFTKQRQPGPAPVGKNWFAKRHRKVLEAVGLFDGEHTIYGYKHTGAINLYLATKDIELVRRHCRHAHAGITATYLRKMGMFDDDEQLAKMPDF
ncbi:tyrosine-type recombinase/integrase [Hymenobacter puniceus]|uniref:tyrosine-type recombinase/integrase n=1 Tax=Hymenobacter sp. BT190 TaxID=2763505 RepID=UPI0016519B39|nr:site-specific integrase [Hymenobacter sp. BT190]MBC6698858.1 site-specific integrase [Hymenobacter sp. BT190]